MISRPSAEKSVRDKAIQKLAAFLSRADEGEEGGGGRLSPKEMQKLWKGLFYCKYTLLYGLYPSSCQDLGPTRERRRPVIGPGSELVQSSSSALSSSSLHDCHSSFGLVLNPRPFSKPKAVSLTGLNLPNSFPGFWMSDKPLVQQALASELSSIVLLVDPKGAKSLQERTLVALEFVGGFWEAIVREWSGIDRLRSVASPTLPPPSGAGRPRHSASYSPPSPFLIAYNRLDKYYMLVRRFTNATFRLLQRSNWDPVCIDAYNAILTKAEGGPLSYVPPLSQPYTNAAIPRLSLRSCS